MKTKIRATVRISRADEMTPSERRAVAEWLVQHAEDLVKDGHKYAKVFNGRYHSRV